MLSPLASRSKMAHSSKAESISARPARSQTAKRSQSRAGLQPKPSQPARKKFALADDKQASERTPVSFAKSNKHSINAIAIREINSREPSFSLADNPARRSFKNAVLVDGSDAPCPDSSGVPETGVHLRHDPSDRTSVLHHRHSWNTLLLQR